MTVPCTHRVPLMIKIVRRERGIDQYFQVVLSYDLRLIVSGLFCIVGKMNSSENARTFSDRTKFPQARGLPLMAARWNMHDILRSITISKIPVRVTYIYTRAHVLRIIYATHTQFRGTRMYAKSYHTGALTWHSAMLHRTFALTVLSHRDDNRPRRNVFTRDR